MKCSWCENDTDTLRVVEHQLVCPDCREDYIDSLPECTVCGKHTRSDKICHYCEEVICLECWDDCGPYCSHECMWMAQHEAAVDHYYDAMREVA